jgi:iron complex transport system substrate-binding protein
MPKSSLRGKLTKAVAVTAALAVGVLSGCTLTPPVEVTPPINQSPSAPAEYTFTDDLGHVVTVKSAQRVVAGMGSFANVWELAGGTLIGAVDDAFTDYELVSDNVSPVGSFTSPNLELIIALEPDLVILTGASTGRDGAASQVELREGLVGAGITVAYFTVTVFEDYLRMLGTLTDITGRVDLFQSNGTAVEERIANILIDVPAMAEPPTVLLMTTFSGGTRVQTSATQSGTILAELGARNLADENRSLLSDFSLESVIELNPDFILVVPMGNDAEAALKNLEEATAANPAWASLDAVKNDRYKILDMRLFLYKPNNNWDVSYQTLFDILYS